MPAGTGLQLIGLGAPPLPFVPEEVHFAPGYGLAVVGWGSPEEHAELIQPIRDTLAPLFELVTPIPYAELQKMLDDSAPWGILGYEKALYLAELDDGAIDVIAERFPAKASPLSIMPIFPLGGAYAEVADDATALGRPARRQVDRQHRGGGAHTGAARSRSRLGALAGRGAATVRRQGHLRQLPERPRRRQGPGRRTDRRSTGDWRRIKAHYDPDNVFHYNANIKPAR